QGRKRGGGLAHADEDGAVIVHLKRAADVIRLVGPQVLVAGLVDDHGVGPAQVAYLPGDHFLGSADQAGVGQAEQDHRAEVAVVQAGADLPLVHLHGPLDIGNAAHTLQGRVGQAGHLIDVADLVVHDPDVGVADIKDLARRAFHDAHENGRLL